MIVQQINTPLLTRNDFILPPPCNTDDSLPDLTKTYCALAPAERARRFVSTADIAAQYSIAQRTFQDWISNGLLAAVKVGKKYQVDTLSVEAYLLRCAQQREVI